MDRSLGLGYLWGSVILVTGLAATLGRWYARRGHLYVNPIVRRSPGLLPELGVPADRDHQQLPKLLGRKTNGRFLAQCKSAGDRAPFYG